MQDKILASSTCSAGVVAKPRGGVTWPSAANVVIDGFTSGKRSQKSFMSRIYEIIQVCTAIEDESEE